MQVWWCQVPLALCMLFGTLFISKRFLWDSYSTYQLHHAILGRTELPHSSEGDGKRKRPVQFEQKRKRVTAEEFNQLYNRPMSTQDYDPEKSWIPQQVFESKRYAIFPHDSHHLVEREFEQPDAIDAEIPFEEGSDGKGTLVRRSGSRQSHSSKSLSGSTKSRHTSPQVSTQKTRSRTRWRDHPVVAWVSALIGINNALQRVSPQTNPRRGTVWELQVWKYSKFVRDQFIFFSPLKMLLYFIALYCGSFAESLLLIFIAYMHCGFIYVLCSSYEARERDQILINAEAYFLENKVNREPAHSVYLNFVAHQTKIASEPTSTPSSISQETVRVIDTIPDTPVEHILPVSREVSSTQTMSPLEPEKNIEGGRTTTDAVKLRTTNMKTSPPNIFQRSRSNKR